MSGSFIMSCQGCELTFIKNSSTFSFLIQSSFFFFPSQRLTAVGNTSFGQLQSTPPKIDT